MPQLDQYINLMSSYAPPGTNPQINWKDLYKNSDFQQQFVLVGDEEDR